MTSHSEGESMRTLNVVLEVLLVLTAAIFFVALGLGLLR